MSNEEEVQEIEISIEQARELIELKNALERLTLSSPDFKKVFLEGYLKDEALRLVNTKADPEMATPENQALIITGIDSIGYLQVYLRTIMQRGRYMESQLQNDLETKEELLAEAV